MPASTPTPEILRGAAWPLALLVICHRLIFVALPGTGTDDFSTVYFALRRFLSGEAVYDQAYNHVAPLYLYNPGATLLLSPMALSGDRDSARTWFILFSTVAVIAALAILCRLFNQPLSSPVFPIALAATFATEAATNTLSFSNINGVLFLLLAGWLYCFVRAATLPPGSLIQQRRYRYGAGILLGLLILIKPQFAPLLALVVLRADVRGAALAVAIPVGFNIVAWPLTPGVAGYRDNLLPYLSQTRDFANASLPGAAEYFKLSPLAFYPVWLAVAACCALGLLLLLSQRTTNPLLWTVTTTSAILSGVFVLSSLGQQYYSLWLIPLVFTVLCHRSVFHSSLAWGASALIFIPWDFSHSPWPMAGQWLGTFGATIGWILLIVAIFASALGWWLRDRQAAKASAAIGVESAS